MTLRELRYLVALAEHEHFGRAAEACHISQPTLSTQLRKLEEELGVMLFERTNKSLNTTPIGRKIVDQARRVLVEADAIKSISRQTKAPLSGQLTLGVIPTLGPYLLPWLVPLLKRAYPDLRLILHENLTDDLIEHLHAYHLDAIVVALPIPGQDFEIRPLFDEPFFLVCPSDTPLAEVKIVRDDDFRHLSLLLLTDGHCLRDQALAVCGQREANSNDENADFRATSLETLRQMVAAGMGSTLLPALAVVNSDSPAYVVRPLASAASRRIGLIWRRSYPKNDDLDLVAKLICDNLPSMVHAV